MEVLQKKILSQFSHELQNHIIEFCKDLSAVRCDVFILLARKAACFVSVLEDVGLLKLNGKVVSERILDFDCGWLKGKDVVIVDDTIISGTSIFKIIEDLNNVEVKSTSVKVFCVDEFWFVNDLLVTQAGQSYLATPYLSLDHTATLKFCQDVVKTLSIYPRPYSTDFPIYESIRLYDHTYSKISNLKNWKVVDTTSKLQASNGVNCFSLNPKRHVVNEFFSWLGVDLKKHSFLKLRFYCQKFELPEAEKEKSRHSYYFLCRVLPLTIFDPISYAFLDELIAAICSTESLSQGYITQFFTTNISKLRFVQFYFARKFFDYSMLKLEEELATKVKHKTNRRELDLIFPPNLVDRILAFQYESKIEVKGVNVDLEFASTAVPDISDSNAINPYLVKEKLLNGFLRFYHDKELKARRLVKEKGKKAFADPAYDELINRLNQGFTFSDLKRFIKKQVHNSTDQNLIISEFLDTSIDSGIVVPVTLDSNQGYTSRGYRHGEEIVWGENNDKLLSIFYSKYLSKTETTVIKKLTFEKLLVLFLKMGLKAGVLEEYNYALAPTQTINLIAIRAYLYGEVTIQYELKPGSKTSFNPILDHDVKGFWTSQRLSEKGVLRLNENDAYELDTDLLFNYLDPDGRVLGEPSDVSANHRDKSEEIAELLAIATTEKLLNQDKLVILTSCVNLNDCLASIAAELYIFEQSIKTILIWVSSAHSRNIFSIEFLTNLRSVDKNHAWTAVNSGAEKFMNFRDGKGKQLVDEISQYFSKIGSFIRRSWDAYWDVSIEKDSSQEAPELNALCDEIGLKILDINIILNIIHEFVYELLDRNGQLKKYLHDKEQELGKIIDEIESIQRELDRLNYEKSNGAQISIDALLSPDIAKHEERLVVLRRTRKNLTDNIRTWKEYSDRNHDRVEKHVNAIYKVKSYRTFSLQSATLMFSTKAYKAWSDDNLKRELLELIQQLNLAKDDAANLLKDFSLLVPHWGKIVTRVRYNSLIHIDTTDQQPQVRKELGNTVIKEILDFEFDEFGSDDHSAKSVVMLRPSNSAKKGYFIGGKGPRKTDRMLRLASRLLKACSKVNSNFRIAFFPELSDDLSISTVYNEKTRIFDEVEGTINDKILEIEAQSKNFKQSLVIYNDGFTFEKTYCKNLIEKTIKETIVLNQFPYTNRNRENNSMYQINMEGKTIIKTTTIGVACALPREFAAMQLMLEDIDPAFEKPKDDPNDYVKGTITSKKGTRIDVIVALAKEMGNNQAGIASSHMIRSFPDLDDIIMSGIAGGVPDIAKPNSHVRLGDIVVSNREGVLQYDNIKKEIHRITIRDNSPKPSARLLGLNNLLEAQKILKQTPWNAIIEEKSPLMVNGKRPDELLDILRVDGKVVSHPQDKERVSGVPKVHVGAIGSANTLLKDEGLRDSLRDNYSVKAIEMEASGIADGAWTCSKGYLVVRGIVDYCNADKNDDWQNYAALCAAAYTKCIIQLL